MNLYPLYLHHSQKVTIFKVTLVHQDSNKMVLRQVCYQFAMSLCLNEVKMAITVHKIYFKQYSN